MLIKLLVVVVGYFIGAFFFCRGFLLTKNSLDLKSSCSDVQHPTATANATNGCWVPATYKRSIVLVIDALRYDFVAPVDRHARIYHNRFENVHKLLTESPEHGLLFKFVADPPTTTLQRLKGLTTGSLPTFVDAGSNFAGSAIDEDNIIDQLITNGKNVTFMGDDTWAALFPQRFGRSFPFPSFDVQDLHTVDNGVLRHIYNEIKLCDWHLLIAHFLGVDHCGHKYGPNHPEMSNKLKQMDEVIKNVTDLMDDETVLFVFGDHGMTETGDHGGDSDDELGAALFVYSKKRIHNEKHNVRRLTAQMNIVPTLALLLDVPIPYSNLGAFIPELFTDFEVRQRAAKANVHQVVRYTETYLRNFRDTQLAERFSSLLKVFNNLEPQELTVVRSVQIIRQIGAIFTECWAKFHLGWMLLGMLAIFENFLSSVVMIRTSGHWGAGGRSILLKVLHLALFLWAMVARNENIPPVVGIVLGVEITIHVHSILTDMLASEYLCSVTDLISMILIIAHTALVFSNSYIVHEDAVSRHFINAYFLLLLCHAMGARSSETRLRRHRFKGDCTTWRCFWKAVKCHPVSMVIVALLLTRMGVLYRRCREEMVNCETPVSLIPFGSLFDSRLRMTRIVSAVFGLLLIYWIPKSCSESAEPSRWDRSVRFAMKICVQYSAVGILFAWCYSWLVELYPKLMDTQLLMFFPRSCYALMFFFLLLFLSNPIDVCPVFLGRVSDLLMLPKSDLDIISKLKCKIQPESDSSMSTTLCLIGARSALAKGFLIFLWMLLMFITILLGSGFSLSIVGVLLLLMIALKVSDSADSEVWKGILLVELANYGFYAFGHQPTFAAIPWDAAFVGIPGNFRFVWLQASLVIFNIGASFIFVMFAAPLTMLWKRLCENHQTAHPLRTVMEKNKKKNSMDDPFRLNLIILTVMGLKVVVSIHSSAMHRRHLMMWKVFAPKLIFEGTLFIVASFAILLQYSLWLYLDVRLRCLLKSCISQRLKVNGSSSILSIIVYIVRSSSNPRVCCKGRNVNFITFIYGVALIIITLFYSTSHRRRRHQDAQ